MFPAAYVHMSVPIIKLPAVSQGPTVRHRWSAKNYTYVSSAHWGRGQNSGACQVPVTDMIDGDALERRFVRVGGGTELLWWCDVDRRRLVGGVLRKAEAKGLVWLGW